MFVSLSVGFLARFLCVLKSFLCSISKKLLMLRLYSYPFTFHLTAWLELSNWHLVDLNLRTGKRTWNQRMQVTAYTRFSILAVHPGKCWWNGYILHLLNFFASSKGQGLGANSLECIDHRVLVLGTYTCVVKCRNVYFRQVDQEEALREGI